MIKFKRKRQIYLFLNNKKAKMEMSINFKKLFNFDESSSNTPSTSSLQNSYHIDEPSIISNASNNINIHYKFSEGLFFDTTHQGDERELNISGDLSSIGRSFQQDYEEKVHSKRQEFYKQPQKYKATKKSYKNDNEFKNSKKGQQTFYLNEKDTSIKTPGQRLYYESKIKNERKLKQLERIKHQLEQQQAKEVTFKPALNQKSKRILQLADSPLRKMENMKKSQKEKKVVKQLKSTVERKQEEEMRNCTFKPAILKTPKSVIPFTPNRSSNKDLSTVFDSLYNEHKAKIQRKRKILQQQQQEKKSKTMSKQQLQQFFHRNQQYIEQKKHRQELLKAVSSQYDLTSGRKLFQPKINASSSSGQLVSSLSMAKFSSTQQLNTNKSQKKIKQPHHLQQRNNNLQQKNKKANKQNKSNNNVHQNGQQRRVKPMAYQVTKFISEQKGIQQDDVIDTGRQYSYMNNGKSSIFNKIAITQQLNEIDHQQEIQNEGYEQQRQQLQSEEENNINKGQEQYYEQEEQRQQQQEQDHQQQNDYNLYGQQQQQQIENDNHNNDNLDENRLQKYEIGNNEQTQNRQQEQNQENQNDLQDENESVDRQSIDKNGLQQVQKDQSHDMDDDMNDENYENYESQRSLPHQPTQRLFIELNTHQSQQSNQQTQTQYHINEKEDQQGVILTQLQQPTLYSQPNQQQQQKYVNQQQSYQSHQQTNQQDEQFHPYQQQLTPQQQSNSNHITVSNDQQPHQQLQQLQNNQSNNTAPSLQLQSQQQQQQQKPQQQHITKQLQLIPTSRKQSQDDDITKRTNFLQSVVKNPIYTHKYNDLLSLDYQNQQQSYLKTQNNTINVNVQPKQSNAVNNYESIYSSKQQLLPILNPNQQKINTKQSNHLSKQKSSTSPNKPSLFAPIFLSKDSQQDQSQQKTSPKSWQEIFNASTKIQKNNITPSQSGISQRSRVSQLKASSNLSPQQSPKKKAINIASLLKAKKKLTPKA